MKNDYILNIENIKKLNKRVNKNKNLENKIIYLNGEFKFKCPDEFNTVPMIEINPWDSKKNRIDYRINVDSSLDNEIKKNGFNYPISVTSDLMDNKSLTWVHIPFELLINEPRIALKRSDDKPIYIKNLTIQIIDNMITIIDIESVKFREKSEYNVISELSNPKKINNFILETYEVLTKEEANYLEEKNKAFYFQEDNLN